MKWTLIYFDDQPQNIQSYEIMLKDRFNVISSTDPSSYHSILKVVRPHAILVNIHMPMMDGFSLHKQIAQDSLYNGCPFFFISGDQTLANKLLSYEDGAVDFLPQTISQEELVVRISSKIKMYLGRTSILEVANLRIDINALKCFMDGKVLDLTLLEMRLISTLLREFPGPVNRKVLVKKVWGDQVIKPGTLSTHITNVRNKLQAWNYYIKVKENSIWMVKN